ncbi:hypothetical protein BGZ90_011141 [Linnemannia elongata]|nr:hypothetical protein BGZ90_011141 [Linnemannia elongata]
MTTAASPIVNMADHLPRERSVSNASKHLDYQDRTEPRSSISVDYTNATTINNTGGSPMRHQYTEDNNSSGYSELHNDQQQQQQQQQDQQQQAQYDSSNNSNGHHYSSAPTSSGYPANGAYLPHPIQTTGQALGNGSNGGVYSAHGGHPSNLHNSFASPTSPALSTSPLSPINTHNLYQPQQQQQQQHGHYEYDHSQQGSNGGQYQQQQQQPYYPQHASYPQEHHQHPLSPTAEGNGHYDYSGYPVPVNGNNNNNGHDGNNSTNNNGNTLSNGSYSSSSSSSHYPRNHSYSHHHGSMDEQAGSPDMATGSDRIVGDNIAAYASSAHSPTSESMMSGASRNRKRSEVFATHESPYFFPAHQLYNVMSMDRSTSYTLKLAAKIDRGFFLASNDWTCYRRNYFQISACFFIPGLDTTQQPEVPCLLDYNGELLQVNRFLVCIGAQIQHGDKAIELVQHTPKRDKGPQITPKRMPVRAGGDLSPGPTGLQPYVVTYEREDEAAAAAATSAGASSAPGTSSSTPYPSDERYPPASSSYRNDSISSSNGGDYSYYPNYGYNSSSYPYQSLGSASHMAAQDYREDYHYNNNSGRHDSESYPASPLSPSGPHPHAYMTPQVQHGFSPAASGAASPDMYSPSGFPENGAGHYQYGSPTYPQYPQQHPQDQHHHYHQDGQQQLNGQYNSYNGGQQYDQETQDHAAQLAALRIHSPISPGSPLIGSPTGATPRRQSFSSALSSKKAGVSIAGDRSSIGSTRKSRSISMSGITKRAPSKTRTSRTVPATPTKEHHSNGGVLGSIGGVLGGIGGLGGIGHGVKGLGISSDRIPENPMEEQQS